MYQADFICTYKEMDVSEDQEMLYKIQLLQALDLKTWDDDKVKQTLEELYNEIKNDKHLSQILEKVSKVEALQIIIEMTKNNVQCDKDLLLFSLLFQYEYFDLFHNCIIDFKYSGEIGEKHLQTLLDILF